MPADSVTRRMGDEAVLVLPRDDTHYYTYEEVELSAVGVARVVSRSEARAAGYTSTGTTATSR